MLTPVTLRLLIVLLTFVELSYAVITENIVSVGVFTL